MESLAPTVEAAKVAWRELVALYHPDRHRGASPAVVARASDMFRQVNAAWNAIRDGDFEEAHEARPTTTRSRPGVVTGSGFTVPDGTYPPITTPALRLKLPLADEPHPNVVVFHGDRPTAVVRLKAIASHLGWKRQPKADPSLLLFTRGALSATGVVVRLRDSADGVRIEITSSKADMLEELLGALRREAVR